MLCGHLAFSTIYCMSFQKSCSGVKPIVSRFSAAEYFRKSTPMKKLRKKKLPTRMNTMKKSECCMLP